MMELNKQKYFNTIAIYYNSKLKKYYIQLKDLVML